MVLHFCCFHHGSSTECQQEIDLLKNLNHKNIVKYLGSLKTKTHLHIILEYVENGSLENIIKPNKFGPFTESLAVRYISQVLEGLVYLHEQGVIHRDIKGANILTTKEGLVKLADFGVATKLNEADLNTHSVVGTPYWMAPEVIEMSGVCAASDIWSVGCTVIELLTCVPPYYDLQPMPALFRIVQDVHPPIPEGLSPDMVDFLYQCFKKDAMQRPDAKTLLLHPWIQNKRHSMQKNHIQTRGTLRIIESGDSVKLESIPCDYSTDESSSRKIMEMAHVNSEEGSKGLLPMKIVERSKQYNEMNEHNATDGIAGNHTMDISIDQDLTLSLHEKKTRSPDGETSQSNLARPIDVTKMVSFDEVVKSSNVSLQESNAKNIIRDTSERERCSNLDEINHFTFDPRIQVDCNQKVFDDNVVEDSTFPLQALEFGKLVSFLKPEESEDTIVSACQKLIMFFHRRPEQKHVFLAQHGLVPLMELLALPRLHVVCSVLQIINQIIKDNINFQENACLIGLIPDIMIFAKSDHPREVRMEAAFFFQQLCQSSSLTLQMFIACHGIPVLVDFLEPDYAKYRVMVHLAIDGMWQVFKLQHTLRNDFCRIATKSGILIKLINTIHSLNEATRLASLSEGSGSLPLTGSSQHPQSGLLDSNHHFASFPSETPISYSRQIDQSKFRQSLVDSSPSTGSLEPSHIAISNSQTSVVNQSDGNPLADVEKHFGSHETPEASVSSKSHGMRGSVSTASKDWEQSDLWKMDSSLGEVDSNRKRIVFNYGSKNSNDSAEPVRPLLSLLDKEPRSRHASGHLEYVHHLSSLEKRDNVLLTEFAEASLNRKEIGSLDLNPKNSSKIPNKVRMGSIISNEGSASKSEFTSHAASGVMSESDVLNTRSGSATSSCIVTQTVPNADVAREYLEKVADLLLEFSQADSIVKTNMCSQSLLSRVFQMFNKIEPPILLKILKCLNNLTMDPNCLDNLQRAGAIRHLIPSLGLDQGQLISEIHNEVLKALFNLCKINKRRQELAAESGIIPHLMNFITSGSPLKQYALPLLCDMAHASRNSREQLRAQGGLDVYLNLLEDENWAVTALDSLAVCLAHDNDNRKVEQALIKNESINKLVKFFEGCPEQYFVHILEPFLKIITKSSRINTALAVNGLTALLIAKLDHQDAIVRLNLLKLIKAVYEHHPRPKQLIVENDLPQMLQNLIEERRDGHRSGGQVLVKQMATALLKALHINTVL